MNEGPRAGEEGPRVLTVVGARPQFVKAAVVSLAIRSRGIRERILHTGQHYDPEMSDVFFRQMGIPREDHQLGVGSGTHGEQTARVLQGVEQVLLREPADAVLVFGDTNSTVAGALAAAKLHVPVAHVEAGMRSFNRRMPEELNRVVTDHLATWHYCSTPVAEENLRREGIREGIALTGDVMADAVITFAPRAPFPPSGVMGIAGPFGVVTCHRAENTDDPVRLAAILEGLGRLARHLPLWFPMHPRVQERLRTSGRTLPSGVRGLPPLPYLEMLGMMARAAVVVTDSGGIQKEAYLLGVPCVTLRDETEWVESVQAGANRLAGADADRIEAAVRQALEQGPLPPDRPALYGDGRAADRVADHLASVLGARSVGPV
ncbi:MAG TPA: UDP-N-acetylglucosamine 2-epimerase (non-hydrolyzing) [Myxococcota bacterium]|nr:UDP-N-acetylglucosamine 2-epimerase (non-hydrolyzing) [Myxococcota bacterium]HQK49953.1 UDP-N-acetylglucosamine 2-epimerase (non-hydrolyzing) [Myxococcota bacterium]